MFIYLHNKFIYNKFTYLRLYKFILYSLLYPKESFMSNCLNSQEEKIFQQSNFQLIPIYYYVRPFQNISNTCVAKYTGIYCQACNGVQCAFFSLKGFVSIYIVFLVDHCFYTQLMNLFKYLKLLTYLVNLCLSKLTSKNGKRINLFFLYSLHKAQSWSASSFYHSFIAVFPFPLLVMQQISSFVL